MIFRLAFLVVLLFSSPAWGAVALEGADADWFDTSGARSIAIQCGNNPNRVLYVFAGSSGTHTISALTFAGNNVTDLIVDINETSQAELNVFRVIGAPSGSNTLSITMGTGSDGVYGALCFSGVDQVTPNTTPATTTGGTFPNTLNITIPTDGFGVDFVAYYPEDDLDHTVGANQTIQAGRAYADTYSGAWSSTKTNTGSQDMTWDNISTLPYFSHAAFAINPAGAGPGPSLVRRRPVIVQ